MIITVIECWGMTLDCISNAIRLHFHWESGSKLFNFKWLYDNSEFPIQSNDIRTWMYTTLQQNNSKNDDALMIFIHMFGSNGHYWSILRWIFWNCDKCAINRLGKSCICAYVVVLGWVSSSKKQMSTEMKMVNNNWTPANSVNNSSDLLLHFSCLLTILQFNVLSCSLIHSKKCQSQSHYSTSNDVQNSLFQSWIIRSTVHIIILY